MNNTEALFALVKARADLIAQLPLTEREAALALIYDQHERSGVSAGMTPEAALDMASRLDTWIREVLRLRGDADIRQGRLH